MNRLFLVLLLFCSTVLADENPFDQMANEALIDIKIFSEDPFSDAGEVAAGKIMDYAENSLRCIVYINDDLLPWIKEDDDYLYSPILVAAYVSGSIKPQLLSGKIEDRSRDGVEMLLEMYKRILDKDLNGADPHVEFMLELRSRGQLQDFIDEANKESHIEEKDPVIEDTGERLYI